MTLENNNEMTHVDLFEDIISSLNPEDVPPKYLHSIRFKDAEGNERTLKKTDDISHFLKNPLEYDATEARITLNSKKIGDDLIREVNAIYEEVNRRFNER